MGIFNFMKNAGKKVRETRDYSEEIKSLIETELGDQVKNLHVVYEEGTVKIFGESTSQAAKEKAVLLAGNIWGVEEVQDEGFIAPQEEEVEFYTIVSGDTLSGIAKKYYGNAMKYPVIFEANKEVIKDPNLIYPGQTIRIPKLEE